MKFITNNTFYAGKLSSNENIFCFTKHIFLFFLLLSFYSSRAQQQSTPQQQNNFSSNWMLNPTLGFGQFYGDISSQNFFQKFKGATSFASDITANKMFSPLFGVGLNGYFTGLKSIKNAMGNGAPVNFVVNGHYFDFNIRGYINLLNLFTTDNFSRPLSLIGSTGIGYGFWNTTLTDNNTGTSIGSGQTVGTTHYKKSAFVIPIGLTLDYKFAKNWSANIGVDFRTILNDDVDVWHDGFKYDQLLYVKVGISYYINYGWHTRHRNPEINNNDEECCQDTKPIAPIPVYDYSPPGNNNRALNKKPVTEQMQIKERNITPEATQHQNFEYRVQIMAKAEKRENVDKLQAKYHLDYPVIEHFQNGLYLYTVGHFNNYQKALRAALKIKAKGVFDAFVTAYQNGQRITLSKAMRK